MALKLRFDQVLPGEVVLNSEGHVFTVVHTEASFDGGIWLEGADQLDGTENGKDVAAGMPSQEIEAVGRCQWCMFPLPHTGECLNDHCPHTLHERAKKCYQEGQPPWMTDNEWGRLLYLHVLEQEQGVSGDGRRDLATLRLKTNFDRIEGHLILHEQRIGEKGPDECCCYAHHPAGALAACCPICHKSPVCTECNTLMAAMDCGDERGHNHWFCELVGCPASDACDECTCEGAKTGKHDGLCTCSFKLHGHGGPCKVAS